MEMAVSVSLAAFVTACFPVFLQARYIITNIQLGDLRYFFSKKGVNALCVLI